MVSKLIFQNEKRNKEIKPIRENLINMESK